MPNFSDCDKIIECGRLLYDRGFIAGADGNLSVRLDDGTIVITPSGLRKGFLEKSDLVVVSPDGRKISGKWNASSETAMHLFVYKTRPEIMACCHAHPPYATACSIIGKSLSPNVLPEVVVSVGPIALTDYAPPGTDAVPRSLEPFIQSHEAFMLRNHGVLTIGKTLDLAYNRMEIVEHFAKIIYIAENIGPLNFLETEEVNRLKKLKESLDRNGQ